MRKTRARQAVLDTLQNTDHSLSHRDLQELLKDTCDRVTIYRVLGRLTEEGLVHKVSDTEGNVTYAACNTCSHTGHSHAHEHLHFNCTSCGQTRCLEEVEVHFTLPEGYQLAASNFAVKGVCDRCTSA